MGRGKESKLRRRNKKKEEKDNGTVDGRLAGNDGELEANGNADDFGPSNIPLPPGMANNKENDDDSSHSSDSDTKHEKRNDYEELMTIRRKKKKASSCCGNDEKKATDDLQPKKSQGIKTTPLILLILMVGTTILPGLIFASDYIGGFLQKNHVFGNLAFRLGLGSVPKKRVMSFYEKHDPYKLNEIPTILSKYYGDYPKLIKRLERKYQDYGYFLGWEDDEAPLALAKEQLQDTYTLWINSYWNVYAPQSLKTAARNIRYNLTFLQKKFRKAWKKQIWPHLQPFFGVPKGAEKQKREDAAEAKKRKEKLKNAGQSSSSSTGRRRRNTEYRDDVED